MPRYTTADTIYSNLNGYMDRTGNDITTYHSTTLGDANTITNNQPPPLISCVVTWNTTPPTTYTICGKQNGTGFSGTAQSGSQTCPSGPQEVDDDWTATANPPVDKPKPKSGKKSLSKKK